MTTLIEEHDNMNEVLQNGEVVDIIKELNSSNSKNFKLDTLRKYKDNEVLQILLKFTYDLSINYWQKKIPNYLCREDQGLYWALQSLKPLINRKYTGHEAVDYLKHLLECINIEDAKLIEGVIKRDLRINISAKSVNKVWPGLIPEFNVMLASSMNPKNISKIKYPALAQTKEDGMRVHVICSGDKIDFYTRNGKPLQGLTLEFANQFSDIARSGDWVIDGELLIKQDGRYIDRKTGNGILNKSVKGTITPYEAEMVHAVVWDIIPIEQFYKGKYEVQCSDRLKAIGDRISYSSPSNISLIKTVVVNSYDEVMSEFCKSIEEGKEGLVVKNTDGIWEGKRSKHWVKIKIEETIDLLVTDVIEGAGKYKGMMGALSVEDKSGTMKVNVGSGFNDGHRIDLFCKKDIIGKIVEVKFNEIITSKDKKEKSLFLPIFVKERPDKTEADTI